MELWQLASILSAWTVAVVWLTMLSFRVSEAKRDAVDVQKALDSHQDACGERYAQIGAHRDEDREWMRAISEKLDRLVEVHPRWDGTERRR